MNIENNKIDSRGQEELRDNQKHGRNFHLLLAAAMVFSAQDSMSMTWYQRQYPKQSVEKVESIDYDDEDQGEARRIAYNYAKDAGKIKEKGVFLCKNNIDNLVEEVKKNKELTREQVKDAIKDVCRSFYGVLTKEEVKKLSENVQQIPSENAAINKMEVLLKAALDSPRSIPVGNFAAHFTIRGCMKNTKGHHHNLKIEVGSEDDALAYICEMLKWAVDGSQDGQINIKSVGGKMIITREDGYENEIPECEVVEIKNGKPQRTEKKPLGFAFCEGNGPAGISHIFPWF
jgi:hypothetical protein